jgi:hypothetical protein
MATTSSPPDPWHARPITGFSHDGQPFTATAAQLFDAPVAPGPMGPWARAMRMAAWLRQISPLNGVWIAPAMQRLEELLRTDDATNAAFHRELPRTIRRLEWAVQLHVGAQPAATTTSTEDS